MCSKCNQMSGWDMSGDYPRCIYCGNEDYTRPAERKRYSAKGLSYLARYAGKFESYKDHEVLVHVVRSPNNHSAGVLFKVNCPWCDNNMVGKVKEGRRHRFQCKSQHSVTIENQEDGTLYWD